MPKYAVIVDNTVANLILADSAADAKAISGLECLESEAASIGWIFNPETGVLSEPLTNVEDEAPLDPQKVWEENTLIQ